ncbi:hypothetical protein J5226_08340 [Lysobacter sp. K5869]|uniref:hypothetical protein n=1 Tax=Lysobacter sp. K5869 TaxID=2820808 RepID=UPI001C0624A5|nr:hypothetical protein [Lysobacter sp. K5869]QWP78385.1 hypothetical protein J5226_08340 [Lysobacter sp. K5869]
MTAQIPDLLINECEALDFSGLHLRRVLKHVPESRYGWDFREGYRPKATPTPRREVRCSALWAGYRSVYRVDASARISLVAFEYSFDKGRPAEALQEPLLDDVWLRLSEKFGGPGIHVPVRSGVVQGRESWLFEIDRGGTFLLASDLKEGQWPPELGDPYDAWLEAMPCRIVVRGAEDVVFDQYDVYLDRYVTRTPIRLRDVAPGNGMCTRLAAGSHVVILRERVRGKLDRKESNALRFSLEVGQSIEIVARRSGGQPYLEISEKKGG